MARKIQAAEIDALTVTSPVRVPFGYGRPVALAADPTAAGVWFLGETESDVSAFFWDAETDTLRQYKLGSPMAHGLVFGIQAAIAVAPDGTIWVGANSTLVEIDPTTSQVSFINVPTPPDNASAEAVRPQFAQGYHAIESLSVDSREDVAVAMSAASAVMVYHSAIGSFTQLALPSQAEPLDVAFTKDGTLGVAATNWAAGGTDDLVDIFQSGVSTPIVAESVSISAQGSQFVTAGYQDRVQVIASSPPGAPTVKSEPTSNLKVLVGPKALMMPSGNIVVGTTTGFGLLAHSGASVKSLSLPTFDCSNLSVTPRPGSATITSSSGQPVRTCQGRPIAFVIDAKGNVWFTSNYVGHKVSEVPAGTL